MSPSEGLTGGQRPIIISVILTGGEMTRWMKVAAVALAVVVGLVPAFAVVGFANAAVGQQIIPVLPIGEELDVAELEAVEAEHWEITALEAAGVVYYAVLSDVFMFPPAVAAVSIWAWGTPVDLFHRKLHEMW